MILPSIVIFDRLRGIGTIGDPGSDIQFAFAKFTNILSTTIAVLTISGGIWFIFQIFSGAIQWLTAGGEKQALQNAQKRIVNAIIGLLVVVLSYALISIIGLMLGFNILSPARTLNIVPGGGGGPTPTCGPGPC